MSIDQDDVIYDATPVSYAYPVDDTNEVIYIISMLKYFFTSLF
jgi:hypothetical protein